MTQIIGKLLVSHEPSIRYKVLVNVLGKDQDSKEIKLLQEEIKNSPRIKSMLERRVEDNLTTHPYSKWHGAHWVLSILADIGYPQGDGSLIPLRKQVYEWLFSKKHEDSIKTIKGRVRRCGSQEGNALYYLTALGLADVKTDELANRLIKWQWEDGGWNCDKKPKAINSSYNESLIPFRGFALHAKVTGSKESKEAANHCSELFLKRRLFKTLNDGKIIKPDFIKLHYPCYWHYDILFALKVLAEAGFIHDERCSDSLALLESKRLSDGGFPSEFKYYRKSTVDKTGNSPVDWGGTSIKYMNEFVTVDALYVLKEAGSLSI